MQQNCTFQVNFLRQKIPNLSKFYFNAEWKLFSILKPLYSTTKVMLICTISSLEYASVFLTGKARILAWKRGQKKPPVNLLICTLISENQGLEKSRSISNPRKISGPTNLDFFFRTPPWKKHLKKLGLYYKHLKKKSTWNFSRVWNRHWYLEALIFRNQGSD